MTRQAEAAMSVGELAEVLAVPSLENDLAAVERRVNHALAPFKEVLGESLVPVVGPAKRLRPILTIACARLAGGQADERVAAAGAAVELMQIGSLIHDDIIEEAPTRRGRASVNATEGVPVALVVGDLVMANATLLAAGLGDAATELIADAMARMSAGQLAELRQAFDTTRTDDDYVASIRGKTAALFGASCRLGGLLGGMPRNRLEDITEFGLAFGVAFQMVDDLLDLAGEPARLGKPVGSDMAAGVYTAPTIAALKKRGGKTLAKVLAKRDVREATRRVLASAALPETEARIVALADDAERLLHAFGPQPAAVGLRRFPRYYVDWALGELVAR